MQTRDGRSFQHLLGSWLRGLWLLWHWGPLSGMGIGRLRGTIWCKRSAYKKGGLNAQVRYILFGKYGYMRGIIKFIYVGAAPIANYSKGVVYWFRSA
jgi:hypothetical protein